MTIYSDVSEIIGNTPLLRLPVRESRCEIYLKLEKYNPGQSVKDRAAINMILRAEKRGRIKPGDTIIESSSGNTGISLAMLAAARGYRFICVVDNHVQEDKVDLLKAYGAVIERVGQHLPPDYHAAKERVERVKELCGLYPDAFFVDQGDNLDNSEAHYTTTAEEIIAELGMIDYLMVSVGTGGTISGTSRRLKETNPSMLALGVEPTGSIIFGKSYSPFFQSGAGSARLIFKNVDFSLIDDSFQVTDHQAFNTCRYLSRRKGLLFGGSGGAVIYKAIDIATRTICRGKMVVVVPDGGERYLTTIYNDVWMEHHNLLDPTVWQFLDMCIGQPNSPLR